MHIPAVQPEGQRIVLPAVPCTPPGRHQNWVSSLLFSPVPQRSENSRVPPVAPQCVMIIPLMPGFWEGSVSVQTAAIAEEDEDDADDAEEELG